jgi:hypothetical protein
MVSASVAMNRPLFCPVLVKRTSGPTPTSSLPIGTTSAGISS